MEWVSREGGQGMNEAMKTHGSTSLVYGITHLRIIQSSLLSGFFGMDILVFSFL